MLLRGPGGAEERVPYDRLVIGTGAVPIEPPIEGALRQDGVHLLRTMDDTFALQERLGGRPVGGDRRRRLHRSRDGGRIDPPWDRGDAPRQAPAVMTTVDAELGELIGAELAKHDVRVRTDALVRAIERSDDRLVVSGTGFDDASGDVVLVVVSVLDRTSRSPKRPAWSSGSAARSTSIGLCGRARPTSTPPDDCVETWHALLTGPTYLPLGTTAHKQGRIAGENAVGGDRVFKGSLGTQVVKVFDLAVARTGLRDRDGSEAGFEPSTPRLETWDHKVYYPAPPGSRSAPRGDRRTAGSSGSRWWATIEGRSPRGSTSPPPHSTTGCSSKISPTSTSATHRR